MENTFYFFDLGAGELFDSKVEAPEQNAMALTEAEYDALVALTVAGKEVKLVDGKLIGVTPTVLSDDEAGTNPLGQAQNDAPRHFFDPDSGGFLHIDINDIPINAIALSDEEYSSLGEDAGRKFEVVDGKVVATVPVVPLEDLKRGALSGVREIAFAIRNQIQGEVSVERAIAWMLKSTFATYWSLSETDSNPKLAPLATTAQAGFEIEAEMTGENAIDLRDRSLAKATGFFMATQIVEAMERLAETQINEAATTDALDQTIAQLRVLEAQALAQLAELTGTDTQV